MSPTKPDSKTAHTPGPWIVVGGVKGPKNVAAWICTVGNNWNDPAVFSTVLDGDKFVFGDKLADARLIAAAPDLFDACDFALSILEALGNGKGDAASACRAAIAKAEGRADA